MPPHTIRGNFLDTTARLIRRLLNLESKKNLVISTQKNITAENIDENTANDDSGTHRIENKLQPPSQKLLIEQLQQTKNEQYFSQYLKNYRQHVWQAQFKHAYNYQDKHPQHKTSPTLEISSLKILPSVIVSATPHASDFTTFDLQTLSHYHQQILERRNPSKVIRIGGKMSTLEVALGAEASYAYTVFPVYMNDSDLPTNELQSSEEPKQSITPKLTLAPPFPQYDDDKR